MGGNFTVTPTWVTPRAPQYAVIITMSESFKKDYQVLDSNANKIFDLTFDGVSDTTRNTILSHYSSVTGPYDSFTWKSVPSYLNEGSSMTVRYKQGTYAEEPRERSWQIKFSFEEDV